MGSKLILGGKAPRGKNVARKWCSGTFTVPAAPQPAAPCPQRYPSSRQEAGHWDRGRGAPFTGPPPSGGERGPGQTQGKQAQGAVAAGPRARGTLGHTAPSQEARQLPRAWSASGRGSREGQGSLGGPGVRQSLRASVRSGTQVLGAGTHGGSFWFLVGLVGAEGTAGLK